MEMEREGTIESVGCGWAETDGRDNKKPGPCRKTTEDPLPP